MRRGRYVARIGEMRTGCRSLVGSAKDTGFVENLGINGRKIVKFVLNNLYLLPNIVRMVKLRRMRWTRHVARMEEEEFMYGFGGKNRRRETIRKS
jgi:hypothetical protein